MVLFLKISLDPHYGYIPGTGGRIYLRGWISEFLHPESEDPFGILAPRQLLSEDQLRRMRDLNDAVAIKTGIDPAQSELDALQEAVSSPDADPIIRANAGEAVRDFESFRLRQDAMDYLDADDVKLWANFLAMAIPCAAGAKRDECGFSSRP